MKVQVIVKFDDIQRTFDVPCGLGDKSFKWLGQVASQRYANAAPNGSLRRREGLHGASEHVQFQTVSITTADGEHPYPGDPINEYLGDGDSVVMELCAKLAVDPIQGLPNNSDYATLAYAMSAQRLDEYQSDDEVATRYGKTSLGSPTLKSRSSSQFGAATPQSLGKSPFFEEVPSEKLAKVNFMKVMAKSQMLDEKKIGVVVEEHWRTIQNALKLLKADDSTKIRQTFATYWDMLKDLFKYFTSDAPTILKEQYVTFVEEANVFPISQLMIQASLAFTRAAKHGPNANELNFNYFLLSLLFCAQLKYNDTLDPNVAALKSFEAVNRLIIHNLLPLARKLECKSILKDAFVHANCLAKIRDHYEVLQNYFDKTSLTETVIEKVIEQETPTSKEIVSYKESMKDRPTTINVDNTTKLIFQAGLLSSKDDVATTTRLLSEVRGGTIFGRGIDIEDGKPQDYPMAELTFPEFIEVICRASYYFFIKNPPPQLNSNPSALGFGFATSASTNNLTSVPSAANLTASPSSPNVNYLDGSDQYQTQIIEFYHLGVVYACDFISGKNIKAPPTAKENKRKK